MAFHDDERAVDITRMSPVSYQYAHKKIRRARGKATEFDCVSCGRPASQWAYRGGSEFEQSEERTVISNKTRLPITYLAKWSPDVFAYDPKCGPCNAKDRNG